MFDTFSVRRSREWGPSPSGSGCPASSRSARARSRVVRKRENVELVGPREGRQQAVGRGRQSSAQILEDCLAVDRVRQSLAHPNVTQDRVQEVQSDVLVIDVRRGIGMVESFRQPARRHDAEATVENQKAVEDQLIDLLGRVVDAKARIEIVGTACDSDDDNVGVRCRPPDAGGHQEGRE